MVMLNHRNHNRFLRPPVPTFQNHESLTSTHTGLRKNIYSLFVFYVDGIVCVDVRRPHPNFVPHQQNGLVFFLSTWVILLNDYLAIFYYSFHFRNLLKLFFTIKGRHKNRKIYFQSLPGCLKDVFGYTLIKYKKWTLKTLFIWQDLYYHMHMVCTLLLYIRNLFLYLHYDRKFNFKVNSVLTLE